MFKQKVRIHFLLCGYERGILYDKIADKAKGKIVFVTDGGVICKVISDGKDKPVMIEEDKVNGVNDENRKAL